MRIGFGYDSHRFVNSRKLIIGGVEIPFDKGLKGHSDADVLTHAIIDAVIGALGLGDIGSHFPDTDERWKDACSIDLLKRVVELAKTKEYEIQWIDATVVAEKPRLAPFIETMKNTLSLSGIQAEAINIKAKTNEGMGFIGSGEGIAAFSVCLLTKKSL